MFIDAQPQAFTVASGPSFMSSSNPAPVLKQESLIVGDFELTIRYPVDATLPGDIERLLKGLNKKIEEWARKNARQ